MAAAYVSGLQYGEAGSNADRYILAAATTKHAVGYQGASSRGTFSPTEVFLSWRDQVDTYEVAWRAVLAAGTQAVSESFAAAARVRPRYFAAFVRARFLALSRSLARSLALSLALALLRSLFLSLSRSRSCVHACLCACSRARSRSLAHA